MKIGLPKLDTSNLWDKTYNILKERIIQREFAPNQKLSIPELAEQLGVSRTPIRDALNRLEMDGLIKTISKVGTFVSAIEVDDVLDIMDTRLMLEFWVVDRLTNLPKQELESELTVIESILQQSREDMENLPLEAYLQKDYNLAFHIEFVKLGKNKRNVDIYKAVMNYHLIASKSSLITKEMVLTAAGQHSKIIEALKHGSTHDIKTYVKEHIDDSKQKLLDKLNRSGGII